MNTHTHTGPIDRFELRYWLDPGLSDARRSRDWHDYYPATRAGLALALDARDFESIALHGSYGAAHAYLVAVMGHGEVQVVDDDWCDDDAITESRALDLLTSDGELDPDEVFGLREKIWDGNNHVQFFPSRALAWLTGEAAYQRFGHALVRWDDEGWVRDAILDDGWEIADEHWMEFGDAAWSHGDLDEDARRAVLTEAGIEVNIAWLGDDDVMILVPTADVERAQALMEAADG